MLFGMTFLSDKSRQFEPLVLEHHIRVRAFVRTLGVDPDWVDDVAQEAFLKAYQDWDSFDQSRDFGKWLRGIAANIVRNEVRKQSRRKRLLNSDLAQMLLIRQDREQSASKHLPIEVLKICLKKLNTTNREIIKSRYQDGLSAPDLAEKFEKSSANIRQLLVRIRRQIRLCVERQLALEA